MLGDYITTEETEWVTPSFVTQYARAPQLEIVPEDLAHGKEAAA